MLPFVSLKLSKARAALPLRGMVVRANKAKALLCARLDRAKLEKVQGPLIIGGNFFSDPKVKPLQGTGFRAPYPEDWSRSRKARQEPSFVDMKIWSTGSSRKFCNQRISERSATRFIPPGRFEVYPERSCVQVFQRRCHALKLFQEFLRISRNTEPSRPLERELKKGFSFLRELFPKEDDHFALKGLSDQLGYHLRWLRSWLKATEGSSNKSNRPLDLDILGCQ